MCIFTLWGILFTTKPPVCTLWSWFWWWGGCCLSSFSSSWPHLYLWTLHSKFLTIPSHVCTWCSYWPFWAWRWPNRRLVRVWACSGWPSLKKKLLLAPELQTIWTRVWSENTNFGFPGKENFLPANTQWEAAAVKVSSSLSKKRANLWWCEKVDISNSFKLLDFWTFTFVLLYFPTPT